MELHFSTDMDFFEEVAKYRVIRRVWTELLAERYGVTGIPPRLHGVASGCPAYRAAAAEQRRPNHDGGARPGLRRRRPDANRLLRRGAGDPHRGGGQAVAADEPDRRRTRPVSRTSWIRSAARTTSSVSRRTCTRRSARCCARSRTSAARSPPSSQAISRPSSPRARTASNRSSRAATVSSSASTSGSRRRRRRSTCSRSIPMPRNGSARARRGEEANGRPSEVAAALAGVASAAREGDKFRAGGARRGARRRDGRGDL